MLKVVQPPQKEEDLPKVGKWLYEGIKALGIELDLEGFLLVWTSGSTKMVVDTDTDNNITSAALLAVGKRWTDSRHSATILELKGDRARLIEYCVNIATAFNVEYLAYEAKEDEPGVLSRVHRIDM